MLEGSSTPLDFKGSWIAECRSDVILLALARDTDRLVPHWQIVPKMVDAYIRVDDADEIYAEVQERGAPIDWTIYNAPHGFREFGVQDPDGHDIAFGQPLDE
jgi:hypothetical protein